MNMRRCITAPVCAISHYLPRPHALVVKAHKAVRFDAYLYPRQLLRTEGPHSS